MYDYYTWRSGIPFTDAQIEIAIRDEAAAQVPFLKSRYERLADHLYKTGRLSSKMMAVAMHRLVKHCHVCGKKALYRRGNTGTCREHRLVRDAVAVAHEARVQRSLNEQAEASAHLERRWKRNDTTARGRSQVVGTGGLFS